MLGFELIQLFISIFFSSLVFKFLYSIIQEFLRLYGKHKKFTPISLLNEINCYRGQRHRNSLPVHGQRTRTNARARRGSKKTVTNKKK